MFRFDRFVLKRRPGYRPESAYDLGDRMRIARRRMPVNLIDTFDSVLHLSPTDLWFHVKGLIADFENDHAGDGEDVFEAVHNGEWVIVHARPIRNRAQYDAARRYLTLLERLGAVREPEEHHVA